MATVSRMESTPRRYGLTSLLTLVAGLVSGVEVSVVLVSLVVALFVCLGLGLILVSGVSGFWQWIVSGTPM